MTRSSSLLIAVLLASIAFLCAASCGSDDNSPIASNPIEGGDGEAGASVAAGKGGAAGASGAGGASGLGGTAGSGGAAGAGGQILSPVEWVQDAHDAQRTGYTTAEPAKPWSYKWLWAPPVEVHDSTMARAVHPVTGGPHVYMPAGTQGLFALRKTDGQEAWRIASPAFAAAGAYDQDSQMLFIGGEDGVVYKIAGASGAVAGTYNAASPIRYATLLVGKHVFVVTDAGALHKVDKDTMTSAWTSPFQGGSAATTPPAYSESRNLVVFGARDLRVRAVRGDDGTEKWSVNPTPFTAADCAPYSYEHTWPVVAEESGTVLVRVRLGLQEAWLWGPGENGKYPSTNAELRTYLESKPEIQALYALSLEDGSRKFTPAIGNGGVDAEFDWCDGQGWRFLSTIGPVPALKTLEGGKQVAYMPWRNGQTPGVDGRWDAHLGEMVLDGSTVAGYQAGELRFVQADDSQVRITDEASPTTVAGNTIFYAHWGASESFTLLDRSDAKGALLASPITTEKNHPVVRRVQPAGTRDDATHWIEGGTNLFFDTRYYGNGIWWVYWDRWDPPTDNQNSQGYGEGRYPNRPRYTVVSDQLILVVGNGGDILALSHSGN